MERANKRQGTIEVAANLLTAKGFGEISISEAVQHVGIAEGPIFYCLSRKEGLLINSLEYFRQKIEEGFAAA